MKKIHKILQRLANYSRIPESLEEVHDIQEDIIDVLIEMNGLKKTWHTGDPEMYLEKKEIEQ